MKILIVNYEFPPIGGGAGNATYNIAKQMALKGHEIIILTSQYHGLAKEEVIDGFKVFRIPTKRKKRYSVTIIELLLFTLSSLWYVPKAAKKFKPDVSLAFFGLPCGISTLLLKYLYNIPYVVSLRGADVPGFIERRVRFYHFIAKPLIRMIWEKAFKVVTNSNGLKELATKCCSNIDIDIIANGVNCDYFTPGNNHSNGSIRLLYVGRFSKQKGLNYMAPLIKTLSEKLKVSFHLDLIGDGPERQTIEKQIKAMKLDKYVSFLGWVEKNNLNKKYQEASIFVFPSLSEGMPNAILEAMASGMAIVASNISGNEELVYNEVNGYLVPIGDIPALSSAIIKIAQKSDLLLQMGEKSREIAHSQYPWEHVAEKYTCILDKVL